jgi:DNA polymerase-4
MSRTILHLDLDAFFCSVEEIQNPDLRGKPFAVGGKPNERGVVSSCSYAARAVGVRSAMPMSRALQLCRSLIVVPGRHRLYGEYSEKVMGKLRDLTPLMEQISIDEAFLDISDIREVPARIALTLQADIKNELHLPSSIGIASNKLTAKIATEVGKKSSKKRNEPPFGLTIIPFGDEAKFLAPLPADMLWGVGPKTSARLTGLGIHTIGELPTGLKRNSLFYLVKMDATCGGMQMELTTAPLSLSMRLNPSARKIHSTWMCVMTRLSKRHYASSPWKWDVNCEKMILQEKPSN